MDVVAIGCRLPHGLTLEVGVQTTVTGGPHRMPITLVKKLPNYQRFTLGGTNQRHREAMKLGFRLPAALAPEPFINRNVPKALWDQWLKDHPGSWFLSSGNVFEVKEGDANVKAAVMDAMVRPAPLAPVDPSKSLQVGSDFVEQADFHDKNKK